MVQYTGHTIIFTYEICFSNLTKKIFLFISIFYPLIKRAAQLSLEGKVPLRQLKVQPNLLHPTSHRISNCHLQDFEAACSVFSNRVERGSQRSNM